MYKLEFGFCKFELGLFLLAFVMCKLAVGIYPSAPGMHAFAFAFYKPKVRIHKPNWDV